MESINISIEKFTDEFKAVYEFLYENGDQVKGYHNAVDAFDDFLKLHADFVRAFARYRGDAISSDREAAAFMFALGEIVA